MFKKELLIGLTTLLAWTPSSALVLLAIFGLFTGMIGIFQSPQIYSLLFILLGVTGILGYVALTSVCWGLRLRYKIRFFFLICGVVSLATVIGLGLSGAISWFNLTLNWFTSYLFVGPLLFGIVHLVLHVHFYKKAT